MIEMILRKVRKEEEGFTLIELMVVVLIIGILIAIALPTFLGARNRANDKAAQSSDRNGLVAAKTCFTDHDAYVWTIPAPGGSCDAAALNAIERSLTFVAAAANSTDPTQVSVLPQSANMFFAASYSKSEKCFFIRDDQSAAGAGTQYASIASVGGAGCNANNAPGQAYSSSW